MIVQRKRIISDFKMWEEIKKMFTTSEIDNYQKEGNTYEDFGPRSTGGPKGLGDPTDRTLNVFENERVLPQRAVDIAKIDLCWKQRMDYDSCSRKEGWMLIFNCRDENDRQKACVENYFYDPMFRASIKEEYLNERSHYRSTGIRQQRYMSGKLIPRDSKSDPPLDEKGNYRPKKPLGWNDSA